METVNVYIGRDNTLDLVLVTTTTLAPSVTTYVDANSFDRFIIEIGDTVIDSDDEGFGAGLTFDTSSVVIGEDTVVALRMRLGLVDGITAGSYKTRLVGFNTANPEGLVWQDKMPLKFLD